MDEYPVNNMKDLRPSEQILAYLHQHDLPLTIDTVNAHWEQLKTALGLSEIPHDIAKYLSDGVWKFYEAMVLEKVLKYRRVDLFLHPRFAPVDIHSHSYFEIKYLLSGSANVLVAGQTIPMKAGDLIFIAPHMEHMVAVYDADTLLINIIITSDAAASAFPRIYFSENPLSRFFTAALQGKNEQSYLICHTGSDEVIRRIIFDAYQKRDHTGAVPAHLFCESLVEQLMLEALSTHGKNFEMSGDFSTVPEKLFPILGYINDHCATVNLTTLSKVFNYSTAHLSRLIKQHTGKSFSELLRSARLNQASLLLRASDLPIQEIILRTGYTGKAHFYHAFQETYGMTPAQFRRSTVPLDDIER